MDQRPSASKPDVIRFISGCAQLNTAWNITNRISGQDRRVPPRDAAPPRRPRRPACRARRQAGLSARMMARLRAGRRADSALSGACQVFGASGAARPASVSSSRREQLLGAAAAHGDEVTTGTPSSRDSRATSISTPRWRGDVEHVEHQDQRPAGALEFQHQPEREPQIGGVGDADHQFRQRLAGSAAKHDVAGDFLVGAAGAQRIGARQVDQRDRAPDGVASAPSLRSTVTPG